MKVTGEKFFFSVKILKRGQLKNKKKISFVLKKSQLKSLNKQGKRKF